MLARLRSHARHNVVAYVALFFALSGTALGANAAIKAGDPAGGDLTGTYPNPTIAANAVDSGKVNDNSLTGADIANGGIGTPDFSSTIPAVRVQGTMEQLVSDNTFVTLNWQAEPYDTANLHSTSTNTSRLTAPVAGIYRIAADVQWADFGPGGGGGHSLTLTKNGAGVYDYDAQGPVEPLGGVQRLSTELNLASGDYLEVVAHTQDQDGVDASIAPEIFTMSWVAPG